MSLNASPLSPELYLRSLFSSKACARGEIVRRKKRDIEHYAGLDLFLREIERRGFQVIENSGNFVIFCNQEPIRGITMRSAPLSMMESGPKSIVDFGGPEIDAFRDGKADPGLS